MTTAGANNVPDAAAGATGICRENDDTSQIGCLVDSDPCSVGFAGRLAARSFPGVGSPPTPTSAETKALAVNGVTPFTADPANPADHDKALTNLVAAPGTTPLYPIARRLFVATTYGFGNLKGGERELSQCYSDNTILNAALTNRFVPVPGGVQCLDYKQEGTSTSSPLPNVQGSGSAALPGCNTGLPASNACTDPATAPAICGDGVIATGFGEQCDPPNGTTCSATCQTQTPPAVCGNGVKEGAEACDDNNTVSGDGCSSTCTVEVPVATACQLCELKATNVDGTCFQTSTTANAGTTDFTKFGCNGFSGADKTNCEALLGCMRTNNCGAGSDPTPCLCGNLSATTCATTAVASLPGVCKPQYVAAANGGDVFGLFFSTDSPIGVANNLYTCDKDAPCSCP
jgi:cysteine-rich repeat protein